VVVNTILWENNTGGDQVSGAIDITYSCVQNGASVENNNIDLNPGFWGPDCSSLDLRIAGNSPCIDSGDPAPGYFDTHFPPSFGIVRNDIGFQGGPDACVGDLPDIEVLDVPDDQGGQLEIFWPRFVQDDLGHPQPIVSYVVQMGPDSFEAPITEWTTVVEVPADGSNSYSIAAAVDSTYVMGYDELYIESNSWPVYVFRVVGTAADEATTYPSNTNIGMAMDNVLPAVPQYIQLLDDQTSRTVMQAFVDLEATPDFRETCIFRGPILSLDPLELGEATLWEEAVDDTSGAMDACTLNTGYTAWYESHLNLFYYVGRHVDIHGNYGPATEPMYGQFPTAAPDMIAPTEFGVHQNVPNPFNPVTTIAFDLPRPATVTLRVYDLSGRLVRSLVDGEVMEAGRREMAWRGRDDGGRSVAAGVYLYRLEANGYTETKRMVLVK